jgi:hypothetical protein
LPEGVAIDASGKLHVTNFGANSLRVGALLYRMPGV